MSKITSKVKVFMLEDDDNIVPVIERLNKNGKCEILRVENLNDAAYILQGDPGADYFNKFVFDANLVSEKVLNLSSREFEIYRAKKGLNGLLFLLDNLDLFGDKIDHKKIAIFTAYKVKETPELITPNNKRFKQIPLSDTDIETIKACGLLDRIRYLDGENYYTFSYLDKAQKGSELLEKFIFDKPLITVDR